MMRIFSKLTGCRFKPWHLQMTVKLACKITLSPVLYYQVKLMYLKKIKDFLLTVLKKYRFFLLRTGHRCVRDIVPYATAYQEKYISQKQLFAFQVKCRTTQLNKQKMESPGILICVLWTKTFCCVRDIYVENLDLAF